MGIIKPMMKSQRQGKGGFKGGSGKAPWARSAAPAPWAPRATVPRTAGGKGGKGGKGGGQWVFVPQAATRSIGKSKGKGGKNALASVLQGALGGKGKGGKGKGGKGKGGKGKVTQYKFMDKLDEIDAERKVWLGGLAKDATRGNIVEHFKTAGFNPGMFEILRKGTACISFKTAEDAENAIASLNGSELGGNAIEVDVWTKKEKKERKEGDEKPKKKKTLGVKMSLLKKKPGNSKVQEKLKEIDGTLKAWVGGMKSTTTWKTVKQHFTDLGHEVDMCDVTKPGTAVVTFKTAEETESAIASVDGTEIEDKAIKVDGWGKLKKKKN